MKDFLFEKIFYITSSAKSLYFFSLKRIDFCVLFSCDFDIVRA